MAFKDIKSASVPLRTAIPYLELYLETKFFSNTFKFFPKKIEPDFIDLSIINISFLFF